MGPHALRKRALKSGRKKKEGSGRADPRCTFLWTVCHGGTDDNWLGLIIVYHGARGRFHYFESLQLILRKQIVFLKREWDLPPEFEVRVALVLDLGTSMRVLGGVDCLQGPVGAAPRTIAESSASGTVLFCHGERG